METPGIPSKGFVAGLNEESISLIKKCYSGFLGEALLLFSDSLRLSLYFGRIWPIPIMRYISIMNWWIKAEMNEI